MARAQHASDSDHRTVEASPLTINVNGGPETCMLELRGDLDLPAASALEGELRRAEATSRTVVLDLSNLEFIDSSGIEVLVRAAQRSANGGPCELRLLRGSAAVERTLAIAGLGDLLPFVD